MDIVNRTKRIITAPDTEWPVIAGEPATVKSLYSGFIVFMAAIGPVCHALNSLIFAQRVPLTDITWRPSIGAVIGTLVISYGFSLLGVFVTALVIEKLAPTFESRGDLTRSLKLVAYSQAPLWAAGILNLIPYLGVLTVFAGAYGFYLAYLGLPHVMGTPQGKVLPYLIVVIVVNVVLWLVFGLITVGILGTGAMMTGAAAG